MALPSGLSYQDEYVTTDEQERLLGIVDDQPWRTDLQRRVQHYGYRYDYRARSVDLGMYLGPIPPWASALADRLHSSGIFATRPDQVIVNEYQPGHGIAPHIDLASAFGPVVASISLGSACVMEFSREKVALELALHPGSLLVLTGEARFEWRHGIRARRSDVYNGIRRHRGRRVSLTFRTMATP